jgi:hypothetical protein
MIEAAVSSKQRSEFLGSRKRPMKARAAVFVPLISNVMDSTQGTNSKIVPKRAGFRDCKHSSI